MRRQPATGRGGPGLVAATPASVDYAEELSPATASAPRTCSGCRPSTPTTASGSTATGPSSRAGGRRSVLARPAPGAGRHRVGRASTASSSGGFKSVAEAARAPSTEQARPERSRRGRGRLRPDGARGADARADRPTSPSRPASAVLQPGYRIGRPGRSVRPGSRSPNPSELVELSRPVESSAGRACRDLASASDGRADETSGGTGIRGRRREHQGLRSRRTTTRCSASPRTRRPAEIKKALPQARARVPPDANAGRSADAEERFKEISEAYDVLSDDEEAQGVRRGPHACSAAASGFRPAPAGRAGRLRPRRPLRRRRRPAAAVASVTSSAACSAAARPRAPNPGAPRRRRRVARATLDFTDAVDGRHGRRCGCPASGPARPVPAPAPRTDRRRTCARPAWAPASRAATTVAFALPSRAASAAAAAWSSTTPARSATGSGRATGSRTIAGADPGGRHGRPADPAQGQGRAGRAAAAPPATCTSGARPSAPAVRPDGDNLTLTVPVTFTEAALGAEIQVPTLGGHR